MVGDVGGQLGFVAPSHDDLLAQAWGLPVHFQLQLVGLHEARRFGQPFAELPEKKQEPMGCGLVVPEGGIAGREGAARDGALDQREPRIAIPRLRDRGEGRTGDDGEDDP